MHVRLRWRRRALAQVPPDAGWRRNQLFARATREAKSVKGASVEFHPAWPRSVQRSSHRPWLRWAHKERRPERRGRLPPVLLVLLPGRVGRVSSFPEMHVLFDASNYLD